MRPHLSPRQNGNSSSASIAFFVNSDTSKGATKGNQFIGRFAPWGGTSTATLPTSNNFFGQIGSSSTDSPQPSEAMAWFKIIANNLEVAFACIFLSEKVVAGIKAAIKFFQFHTAENAQALEEATAEAEESGAAQDSVAEEAVEANPGAEAMEPGDSPAQTEAAEAAEAAEVAEAEVAAEADVVAETDVVAEADVVAEVEVVAEIIS